MSSDRTVVEYDEPDADGLQGCPLHPDVPRFDATRTGCAMCEREPAPASSAPEQGPGEKLVEEAARRGLPDAMYVEDRFWNAWAYQTRRSEKCANKADELYETGDKQDLDRAIKLEAAAAKWADTAAKSGKIASASVHERERLAGLDRRARASGVKVPSPAAEVH